MARDYSQPVHYHFSQTSISFVHKISPFLIQLKNSPLLICDAYAGCGVIGLELKERLNREILVDFIEIQEDIFSVHLKENIEWKKSESEIYFMSLAQFNLLKIKFYDVIVANPPFYSMDEVRVSPNPVKAQAHCFKEGSIEDLFILTAHGLKKHGSCFFIFPQNQKNKKLDPLAMQYNLQLETVDKIDHQLDLFLLRNLHENGG